MVIGYCYYSISGISYGLAQSDPIKRRTLYNHNVVIAYFQLKY
jgi:hypothetical protein